MFGKKILILVPHPDDEVVASAITIGHAQRSGSVVYALYLTTGCIADAELWPWQRPSTQASIRREEALMVAERLHLNVIGLSECPARYLWRNLETIYHEIRDHIERYQIDQLWVPAYEGGNPDHDGLNGMVSLFKSRISVLEFAEYNYADGRSHSHHFPDAMGSETIYELTREEKNLKRELLRLYRSERSNLRYVKLEQESYRPLKNYSYDRPPHPGKLWYARFQWVPFRHPRVDDSNPQEISDAIMGFHNRLRDTP